MENLKSAFEFIFSSYKRTATIFFIAALTLAIPITLTVLSQRQDIRQRAATAAKPPPCFMPESIITQLGASPNKGYGDVDGDTLVSQTDSDWILQMEAGKRSFNAVQIEAADVNGPPNVLSSASDVNSLDSNMILQYVAGLISTFPACPTTDPTPTPTPTGIPPTDTIPPTSVITSPSAGSTQTGNFYVSVTDSDAGGLDPAKCEYAVTDYNNGFTVGRTERDCNSQIFITVGSNGNCRTEGTNKCTVRVDSTDNAGNLASLSARSFSISYTDTGGPRITITPLTPIPSRAPTATPTPTTTPTTPCRIPASLNVGTGYYGDVDGDGRIALADSNLILGHESGQSRLTAPAQIEAADVNGPPNVLSSASDVNSLDSNMILQYVAGLISTFPACPTTTTDPTVIPPGATGLSVSISLPGIGVSQNPAVGINNNPTRPQRNVEVMIVNSSNQQVASFNSTVNFDSATGRHRGNVNLGSNFVSGSYLVKVRLDNTLWKSIPGIQNITSGQTYNTPEAALVSGDIIQDNEINLLDYNAMLSCFGSRSCATKVQADLNDDGKVDELDLNILYAGFARRVGD